MKRTDLLNALSVVKPGLGSKDLVEQTTSFVFTENTVSTYNDEISISHPIETEFTGVVKAEEFYQFLSRIKTDEVEFTIADEELRMKAGRTKAGIKLEQEVKIQLPDVSAIKWKTLPEDFSKVLKFVATAASTDASTPALTCIHITPEGIVEATDRYRACRWQMEPFSKKEFLLPANIVSQITAIKPTKISIEKGWLHFTNENETVISCKIFAATFPDIAHLFNSKEKGASLKFPKKLKTIIDRADVFAKREHEFDQFLEITLTSSKMIVYAYSTYGWSKESTKAIYKGDDFKFNIVPKILEDILDEDAKISIFSNRIKFDGADWKYVASISKL
jgi:DNA polymerase III sliding clamp (beta) subunit (PCNA family)